MGFDEVVTNTDQPAMNDWLMIGLAVVLFGTLPALFLYILLRGLVAGWKQTKANWDFSEVNERLRSTMNKMVDTRIGKLGTRRLSSFQRSLVLMTTLFALIAAGYYLMSPYQKCMDVREDQMAQYQGRSDYDMMYASAVMFCLRETSW